MPNSRFAPLLHQRGQRAVVSQTPRSTAGNAALAQALLRGAGRAPTGIVDGIGQALKQFSAGRLINSAEEAGTARRQAFIDALTGQGVSPEVLAAKALQAGISGPATTLANNRINPPAAKPPVLTKDANGFQRFAAGDKFGQRAFPDATGKTPERRIIVQNGIQYFADSGEPVLPDAPPAAPDKPTAMAEKISTLMASGLTKEQAQAVAGGRFAVSLNPVTGERVLVDKGTAEIVPLAQPPGNAPPADGVAAAPAQPNPETGNPTLTQATQDATGVGNNLMAFAAQVPFGIGDMLLQNFPGARDAVRAQQTFEVARNSLIRAFSLNPLFPVAEQQRILSLMPSTGVFSSAEDAKIRLDVLSNSLQAAIGINDQIMKSRAPLKEKQAAQASARAMQEFIDIIGKKSEPQTQKTKSGVPFRIIE